LVIYSPTRDRMGARPVASLFEKSSHPSSWVEGRTRSKYKETIIFCLQSLLEAFETHFVTTVFNSDENVIFLRMVLR
jgi:hypothetical protein